MSKSRGLRNPVNNSKMIGASVNLAVVRKIAL